MAIRLLSPEVVGLNEICREDMNKLVPALLETAAIGDWIYYGFKRSPG